MEPRHYQARKVNSQKVVVAGSLITAVSVAAGPSAEQVVRWWNESGSGVSVEFIPESHHAKELPHTPGSVFASLASASPTGTNTIIGVASFRVEIPVTEPLPGLVTRSVSELTAYLRADEKTPAFVVRLRSA